MKFHFADLFAELQNVATGILAGAANASTPLASIDPSHPIATAAVDAELLTGKALAAAFPQASMIAGIGLQIAQSWATAHAPNQT